MASIEKRKTLDGFTYRVQIRKKGLSLQRTFMDEESAKLFAYYKEKLVDNMEAFEIPLKDRITLTQIIELKMNSIDQSDRRTLSDMSNTIDRFKSIFGDKFLCELCFMDWKLAVDKLMDMDVFKGGKTDNGKRKMSISTVRKTFAHASSSISYAQSQGIELDNIPLKVIQTHINPMMSSHLAMQHLDAHLFGSHEKSEVIHFAS